MRRSLARRLLPALGAASLTLAGPLLDADGAVRAQSAGPPLAGAPTSPAAAWAVLSMPGTARGAALGGAYAAVVGDEGSVFVNPAGMAAVRHAALGLSFQPYAQGASLATGAAAARVGSFDVGIGAHVLEYGQDTVLRPAPGFTGATTSAYGAAAVGAAAYRFGMFSVGASGTYVRDHVATADSTLYDASGLGFDVGGALAFFDIAAFGVVVQNVGSAFSGGSGARAPLPRAVRAGFSLNIVDPEGTTRLMVVGDWISPRGGSDYWEFGLEGGLVSQGGIGVIGRVGVGTDDAPADRRALAYGAGVVLGNLWLDWAYQRTSLLGGGSSRFGLRWVP